MRTAVREALEEIVPHAALQEEREAAAAAGHTVEVRQEARVL
jgi:hypothetical protein